MIRVCYVLSTSENSGGANRSLLDLLAHLDRNRIDPIVLMRRHGNIESNLRQLNIPFTIIPFINAVSTGNTLKDCTKKVLSSVIAPRVKSFLASSKIDIVHNNSFPALAAMDAACLLGIPYICHIRENVEAGLGVTFLDKKRHLTVANSASRKIAVSNFIREAYKDNISDIEVLFDGMNTSDYLESHEILEGERIRISIYGNLDKQKGQLVAVKAIEHLQTLKCFDYVLNIVGNQSTEYGEELRSYVRNKSITNVNFIDTISDIKELKKFRRQDDINLVCSYAEGLGRVTIESMLSGCLTIGASAGATTEILIDRENGLLFPVGDYHALADLLLEVKAEPDKVKRIAKEGQKDAQCRFDIVEYTSKIEQLYEDIMSNSEV